MKLYDEAILEDHRPASTDAWTSLAATDMTYPNGRQITSGYDTLYRRDSVNETSGGASIATWQFFGGRTALVALGSGITCSFMNNAGTRSAIQTGQATPPWGDNTTDQLGYDGSGRLITKRFLPSGSTTALVGFTTSYDPSSNKLFERALHAESRSAQYPRYDSINRLLEYDRGILASGGGSIATAITLPGTDSQRTYNLDHLGNWKNTAYTPVGGSTTTEVRRHNLLNQITKFATTPVVYDDGNNRTSSNPVVAARGNGNIHQDGTRECQYDVFNRLTFVNRMSDSAEIAIFFYDVFGRRVYKRVTAGGVSGTIANATYRYLYDGNQIVEELLVGETTTTLRQFVWGQYIDELIQLNVPATTTTPPLTAGTYYPLQDLLYRTIATTNSSGSIVEAYDYDAYGNTLMYSGAGDDGLWFTDDDVTTLQPMCEYLFTGRQYDPETEIYWYRARYYLPQFGRFISRDPVLYLDGSAQYSYVLSRPTYYWDWTGLEPIRVCVGYGASTRDSFKAYQSAVKREVDYLKTAADYCCTTYKVCGLDPVVTGVDDEKYYAEPEKWAAGIMIPNDRDAVAKLASAISEGTNKGCIKVLVVAVDISIGGVGNKIGATSEGDFSIISPTLATFGIFENAATTLAHELGHYKGYDVGDLAGDLSHSKDPLNLMYPTVQDRDKQAMVKPDECWCRRLAGQRKWKPTTQPAAIPPKS